MSVTHTANSSARKSAFQKTLSFLSTGAGRTIKKDIQQDPYVGPMSFVDVYLVIRKYVLVIIKLSI